MFAILATYMFVVWEAIPLDYSKYQHGNQR